MKPTYSPLRYPGGKSQFYDDLVSIFDKNQIHDVIYCEPFAGGAGVALRLLFEGRAQKIVINDADFAIYSFWNEVLTDTDWFVEKIRNTSITLEEWNKEKTVLISGTKDCRSLGFAAFFLNRTNRSGILRAGPIGGKKQDGKYELGCRFTKETLIGKIKKIALFRNRIILENLDARLFIKKYHSLENSFWFIDPPYYQKGAALYQNFFQKDDHFELCETIRLLLGEEKWILTYDVCDPIKRMYSWAPSTKFSLTYSVQLKRVESEFLFWNKLIVNKGVIPNGFL
jgi:Site-specific DNA methylase